jgi:hypothetical protein
MAKITVRVAGAPFDPGNIFTVPPCDGGLIDSPLESVKYVDAGELSQGNSVPIIVDGGTIPLAGTATYDPTKEYGPDDIIELEFEIPDF